MLKLSLLLSRPAAGTAAGLLSLAMLLTAALNPAVAYQKKVLLEDFTSSTCPPCASFAPTLENLLSELGDVVAPTAIHVGWPAPGNDPWWTDNNDDSQARLDYYPPPGGDYWYVPAFFVDGALVNTTAGAIRTAVNNHADDDSPIEILLKGGYKNDVVTAHVTVTASNDINNARLFVSLQEVAYNYRGSNGLDVHHNAMVLMLPDGAGSQFSIQAGNNKTFDLERDMIADYWHDLELDNLNLVAWVQASNKSVLQAQKTALTPKISLDKWELDDGIHGDGDGRPEPGETVNMVVTLANASGSLVADSYEVTLATSDPGVNVTNGAFSGQELQGGDKISNEGSPLQFTIADNFVAHPVTFTLEIQAQPSDYVLTTPVTIMVGWPPYLVVDASGYDRAGQAVLGTFGTGSIPWADRIDLTQDVPTGDLLANYKAVLWHTFNAQGEIIDSWSQEVLAAYLDAGGRLIISGSYAAPALTGTNLMRNYLAASVAGNDAKYNYVKGNAGNDVFEHTNLFLGGGQAVDWPKATPMLAAGQGGTALLHYEANNQNVGVAAVEHVTDHYATLCHIAAVLPD